MPPQIAEKESKEAFDSFQRMDRFFALAITLSIAFVVAVFISSFHK